MVAATVALQFMQAPTGCVEIIRRFGMIERGELQPQLGRMSSLNAFLAACIEESLQALVRKRLDHV